MGIEAINPANGKTIRQYEEMSRAAQIEAIDYRWPRSVD